MERISIDTSQNVNLEYEIAGLGDRILAYIIDSLIRGLYILMIGLMATAIADDSADIIIIIWILLLPALLYHLLMEIFNNGQSLGKQWRNIRVISTDGVNPSIGKYFIRWVFRLIDIQFSMGIVAIVLIAVSRKGQRLGDLIAGTTVIRSKTKTVFANTLYSQVDDAYVVQFEQAGQLSDQEAQLIAEVLRAARESGYAGKASHLLSELRQRLTETYQIESDLNDLKFLEILLRDYNQIHNRER